MPLYENKKIKIFKLYNLSGEKTKLAWPREEGRGLVSFSGLVHNIMTIQTPQIMTNDPHYQKR
jgi:hypothetical protein